MSQGGVSAEQIFWDAIMFLDISADILFLGFKHMLQPWERDVDDSSIVKLGSQKEGEKTQSCNCCSGEKARLTVINSCWFYIIGQSGPPCEYNACVSSDT